MSIAGCARWGSGERRSWDRFMAEIESRVGIYDALAAMSASERVARQMAMAQQSALVGRVTGCGYDVLAGQSMEMAHPCDLAPMPRPPAIQRELQAAELLEPNQGLRECAGRQEPA